MNSGSHRPKANTTARGTDAQPDDRRVGGGRARTSPPPTAQHKPASSLVPCILAILGAGPRNANTGTDPKTHLLCPAWLAVSCSECPLETWRSGPQPLLPGLWRLGWSNTAQRTSGRCSKHTCFTTLGARAQETTVLGCKVDKTPTVGLEPTTTIIG